MKNYPECKESKTSEYDKELLQSQQIHTYVQRYTETHKKQETDKQATSPLFLDEVIGKPERTQRNKIANWDHKPQSGVCQIVRSY